jgi:hypothetical protein
MSPEWPRSARATASVVVPILMNSEERSGIRSAAARAIAAFSGAASALRAS